MPPAKFNVRCAASLLFAAALAWAGALHAQSPTLRVGTAAVNGMHAEGGSVFPAQTLETLGFRLAADAGGLLASIGTDTLRFWATSPFIRRAARTLQLTHPVIRSGGELHLPEQFFISWLPSFYPDRFEFRGGVLSAKGAAAAVVQAPQPTREPEPPPVRPSVSPATQRPAASSSRTRIVVIDPGHGGRDPGKIGPNGLREKDVALMISQQLAAMLKDRGYEVHLTRTTDTLIALVDRPKIANRMRGDRPVAVFVSIHANAAQNGTARGFETFFLSEARTDDERRVAEMENESVKYEEKRPGPSVSGLDQVLNGLMSDFLLRSSNDLASVVQERLATFHPGPNRGVKRAGFIVLIGSIMPAVLVETAFLSNRTEADLLGARAFQQKIAFGIADALDEFFRRNEHLWVGP